MKKLLPFLLAVAVATPVVAATQTFGAAPKPAPVAAAKEEQRFPLKGVITAVYAEKGTLLIKHEEIPGLMKAMTMAFRAEDSVLKTVKQGQAITATVIVREDDFWLENVKTTNVKK